MKSPFLAVAAVCALWLCAAMAFAKAPSAQAAPSTTHPHPSSLEQAVQQVQRRTGGHILAADSVTRGRNKVYRIKVLTPQGRVRVVQLHSQHRSESGSDRHHSPHGGH